MQKGGVAGHPFCACAVRGGSWGLTAVARVPGNSERRPMSAVAYPWTVPVQSPHSPRTVPAQSPMEIYTVPARF